MDVDERLDRLEKMVELIHHEQELLAIYIPQLSEILIKHFTASGKNRDNIQGIIRGIRSWAQMLDAEMQQHFKSHNSNLDKKRTPIINIENIILDNENSPNEASDATS